MKYPFVLLVLMSLFSCTDFKKGEQILAIEEMNKSLDSIQTILSENNYSSISSFAERANTADARIKMNYESDTLELNFAKKLDAFNTMRKSFSILNLAFLQLSNDIESEKITLKKLKLDIENGNGERDKYANYIIYEKNNVMKINNSLLEYISLKEKTLKTFNDIQDEINTFSLSLLNKKKRVQ